MKHFAELINALESTNKTNAKIDAICPVEFPGAVAYFVDVEHRILDVDRRSTQDIGRSLYFSIVLDINCARRQLQP